MSLTFVSASRRHLNLVAFARKNLQRAMVGLLAFGFALMAGYVFYLSTDAESEQSTEIRYGASWPLSQATVEVARFGVAVATHAMAPSEAGREELELLLDVVAGRAQILHRSPVFRRLREDEEGSGIVAALNHAVTRGEALLVATPEPAELRSYAESLGRLAGRLAQLAARTYNATARISDLEAQQERETHLQTQRVLLLLVAYALCFILLLIRSNQLLQTASAELVKLSDEQRATSQRNALQTAQFLAALDNMAQGLCMFTANSQLIVCNPRFREMFRLMPGRLQQGVALDVALRSAYEVPASARNLLLALIAAPKRWEAEHGHFLHQLDDGRELAIACRPFGLGGWVITFDDVTQQRRNARDSVRLAHELASVIETMPGAVMRLSFDAEGNWRRAFTSDTIERLTGFTQAETMAPDWWRLCTTEADERRLNSELAAFPIGRERLAEFQFRKKGGEAIWLRMALRMEISPEQDITAVIIWTDVTAERALRERLAQSTKLAQLGEVATGVAHELNQPLAAISLSAENALDSLSDAPQPLPRVVQKLERILQLVGRATQVVDHMRIFGRIGTAVPESVRLDDIVEGAETLMRSKLREAGAQLECDLPAELPSLLVHATPVEQVFMNLIGNACDAYRETADPASQALRLIRIAATPAGRMVKITVSDSAGGIPEDVLPRVFEPFFTTKEVGKGTGLGLSISYGIITEMGGTIDVAARDGGTIFTIALPIVLPS